MTRKRVRMELIVHEATCLATFKKRKLSVLKKANELSVLCSVPVYVMLSDGSYNAVSEIWPQSEEASQIISRFESLSQSEQTKKMVHKDSFVAQQIAKKKMQLEKINRENQELQEELLLRDLMSGKSSIADLQDRETVARLQAKNEKQIAAIQKRKEALLSTQEVPINVAYCTRSVENAVPVPPLVDEPESGEKDESFDAASFALWDFVGEKDMPKSVATSLPDWSFVEKEIFQSPDLSHEKNHLSHSSSDDVGSLPESSSGLMSLPDWWNEEDFRDDVASLHNSESVNRCEKIDRSSDLSSALVSLPDWWNEEDLSDDVAPLLAGSNDDEEIMGMLDYYGSD